MEDFRSGLLVLGKNSLAFVQEEGKAVTLGAYAREPNVYSNYCIENNIPIIHNIMPHGAVGYHDSGEFGLYATINDTSHVFSSSRNGIRYLFKAVTAALNFLNVDADCVGNNILVSGKKIGTITAYRFGGVILFHAHVLLDWDFDAAEKAIISPKHDMGEHMRTLKQLRNVVSFDELKNAMREAFQMVFGIPLEGEPPTNKLTDGIRSSIEGLHQKYRSEGFLKYGQWSPVKNYWGLE